VYSGLHAQHGSTDNGIKGKEEMNQIKQTVVALGVLALLAGCTGNDSTVSSSSNGYEVSSGLAQKGPLLRGSSVTVNELNTSTLQPSGKSYTFEVLDDLGTFKPSNITFGSAYLENTALGYYFNELTGQQSSDMVYLRGLSYLGTDKAVNLNVLSTFVKNRVKNLVTTKPVKTFVLARPQAEKELLGAFYIYNAVDLLPGTTVGGVTQPANFMELDLSKKRAGDQILAAISGMVAQIGQTGSGVNYFLNQVETDLADDGLINNSPNFTVSVQQQLSDAAKNTDFAAVAANLNAFYKTNYTATDLSQWVDTSGGVDKVINKYKFSASNIPVDTESKSPEYVAGSEDAGQCFSVNAGKLYRNGATVTTGTVKAVKGDKFVIGLTGNVGGTNYSGFVQRSSPDAKGVCPQVVPNSGLTRVEKYSIDVLINPNGINKISAGTGHALALKNNKTLWSWGDNYCGQLANGLGGNETGPGNVGDDYVDIAGGNLKSFALKSNGDLYGFGTQPLGTDSSIYVSCPLHPVKIDSGYKAIFAGISGGGMGIKNDDSLWAWGMGSAIPAKIGEGYKQVSIGWDHNAAIKLDGSLWLSGGNEYGQLGDGANLSLSEFKKIADGYKVVSAGYMHTLAIKNDGTLWAWGDNSLGQLGDGTRVGKNTPVLIGSNFIDARAGWQISVALKSDGTVWGWGDSGLGDVISDPSQTRTTPLKIGDGFVAISSKYRFVIGIKGDGAVWQWNEWYRSPYLVSFPN
jgi:alpha-tubulin suppressor-like RCC1 family protein